MLKSIWNSLSNYGKPWIRGLAVILLLSTLSACKSKKIIADNAVGEKKTSIANSKALADIQAHQLSFKTFSAKAKSALSLNKDYYDASLNIRIKNNQAIWISITTVLNIEAARVLITPDRFKMMNRLNGTFVDQPFSFIHRFSSPEITFADLQALILGNLISQAYRYTQTAEQNTVGYALDGQSPTLNFHVQTNQDYKPTNYVLKLTEGRQRIRADYTEFTAFQNQQLAKNVLINTISQKLTMDMQIKYSQIVLNEAIETPFSIPTKYKEIN